MKSYYPIIVACLLLGSCNNSKNAETVLASDLTRIESSLSSSISDRLNGMHIDYELNPTKWIVTLEKAKYLESIADSLLQVIYSEEDLDAGVNGIIGEFMGVASLLELDNKEFERNRITRLNYWMENTVSNAQRVSLSIDLRLCVLDILDELIFQAEVGSIPFNVLKPIILESSNTVSVGEPYIAKIGIQAYDSTSLPIISVDGIELEMQDGFGIYRSTSNKSGIKKISGTIELMYNRKTISTEFEEDYEVK